MNVRDLAKPRYKSIDARYPDPCVRCDRKNCPREGMCDRWKTRYLYRQKAINDFAKKYQIQPTDNEPKVNPCERCSVHDNCHHICQARAKWWDIQMEKLRKELGYGKCEERSHSEEEREGSEVP